MVAKFFESTTSVPLEMVYIPGGNFVMGSSEQDNSYSDEQPAHEVGIKPFYMSRYPITQSQFWDVMGFNPSTFEGLTYPVEKVSWLDAKEFCKKLSNLTNKPYRLPTEAEWEYACRAGTTTRYYFGDDNGQLEKHAWVRWRPRSATHPVGWKKPNQYGLYDMIGNVWEWCEDDWHDSYEGAPTDGSAWVGGDNRDSYKVIRGGGVCSSRYRDCSDEEFKVNFIGFRVVL